MGSWSEVDTRIAFPRHLVTDRAGRWLTIQIGKNGRSVAEVAEELGCDWHTINDTLLRYGEALVDDDKHRFGLMEALGSTRRSSCARAPPTARTSPPRSWTWAVANYSTSFLVEMVKGLPRLQLTPCQPKWLLGFDGASRS